MITMKKEGNFIKVKQGEKLIIVFEESLSMEETEILTDILKKPYESLIIHGKKCKLVILPEDGKIEFKVDEG